MFRTEQQNARSSDNILGHGRVPVSDQPNLERSATVRVGSEGSVEQRYGPMDKNRFEAYGAGRASKSRRTHGWHCASQSASAEVSGSEDGEPETETRRAAKWRTTTRTSGPSGLNLLNRRMRTPACTVVWEGRAGDCSSYPDRLLVRAGQQPGGGRHGRCSNIHLDLLWLCFPRASMLSVSTPF